VLKPLITTKKFTLLFFTLAAIPLSAIPSEKFEVDTLMSGVCLKSYKTSYTEKKNNKSYAFVRDNNDKETCGWSYNTKAPKEAAKIALAQCEKGRVKKQIGSSCKTIDIHGELVAKSPDFTPYEADKSSPVLSGIELDALHDKAMDMLTKRDCRSMFRKYLKQKGHKVFVYTVGNRGLYLHCSMANRAVQGSAEKIAFKDCEKARSKDRYLKKFTPDCKLFAKGDTLLVTPEDYGLTVEPLTIHLAAETKSLRTVKKLLKEGADINAKNKFNGTPLIEAAWDLRLDTVKYLLSQKADIHQKESMGFDALNISAERSNLELFKILLAAGGNIHTKTERPGDSPIHHAAKRGNVAMLKILVAKGVDVNIQNNFTETPLHKAADYGRLGAVKYLLTQGANINAKTRLGITPIGVAIKRKRTKVAEYLKSKGAK
jgi:hypothetical protein